MCMLSCVQTVLHKQGPTLAFVLAALRVEAAVAAPKKGLGNNLEAILSCRFWEMQWAPTPPRLMLCLLLLQKVAITMGETAAHSLSAALTPFPVTPIADRPPNCCCSSLAS